jgi:hypothetical protein
MEGRAELSDVGGIAIDCGTDDPRRPEGQRATPSGWIGGNEREKTYGTPLK